MASPQVSIVVPMLNEEENAALLVEAVREAMEGAPAWELILVDDGSTDRTAAIVHEMSAKDGRIRLVRLARRYGQSTAMQAGFDHARADVVVTMDGDLQNDPRDIPELVRTLQGGYDLVAGYRQRRQDRLITRKVPSWIANRIIAWITGVPIRDNGCSLKAYRADLLRQVRLYSEFHRFIPAMSAGVAGARISEIPVRHHPRTRGTSKYGLSRVFRVVADLLTIKMIRSFRLRPLLLFSLPAGCAALFGLFFVAASAIAHYSFVTYKAYSFVFPGIALLFLSLAAFLLLLGLVGETVLREARTATKVAPPLARELQLD